MHVSVLDFAKWVAWHAGAETARMLGVPRQRVTNWLADQGTPTLEQGLRLQAFLKKRRGCA